MKWFFLVKKHGEKPKLQELNNKARHLPCRAFILPYYIK
jgi:hypothetical protein